MATALLLLAGCGSSSSTSSTQSSTSTSSTASTAQSSPTTPQPSPPTGTSASGVVTGSGGGVSASMHATTHNPKVNAPWPIRFTVTRGGQTVRASVSYEYLFGGQVVAHRSHYTFTGHFSDVFHWPSTAVGYPLTFRAVIVAEGVSINLDYPVQVSA